MTVRRPRPGRAGRALVGVAAVALLALAYAGCGPEAVEEAPEPVTQAPGPVTQAPTVEPSPSAQHDSRPVPKPEPAVEAPAYPEGEPVRVVVPAIDVDAQLVELGLNPDGSMEVPDFGLAGWYAEGPRPGHPGPAVVAAHVDSRAGPDVFYRLGELAPGDEILVHYDSGDVATFAAESSERTPKDELPGDRIWPVTADRLLTLITCGGEFDASVRHYRDNVIVYSAPVDS